MGNAVKYVDDAFIYIIVFSLFLLVVITATMVYFVIKYRASKHPEPSDIRTNWKIELIWTVIPTIIALGMFYIGWQSYIGLRTVPPDAIEIDVTGMQYAWVFRYPNNKESESVLIVPQGKPIKLNITSLDVLHSLFIPAFRIKMDAIKNMKTYTWFYADKIGNYTIFCTEYCGVGHADMTGMLRIVTESEYSEWLNKK